MTCPVCNKPVKEDHWSVTVPKLQMPISIHYECLDTFVARCEQDVLVLMRRRMAKPVTK